MVMITLRKALVKKNQLKGRVNELKTLIERKNSNREDAAPSSVVDVKLLMQELQCEVSKLIRLKTGICKANVGIYETLSRLEEAKSQVEWLGSLDTFEGTRSASMFGGQAESTVPFIAQYKEGEVREMRAALKKEIETLLEEVDEFNSTTKIEADFLD